MIKNKVILVIMAIIPVFFFPVYFSDAAPDLNAAPEITGEAAVLIDGKTGQVLFEKNAHRRMYPASTTKILTAVLALEKGALDEVVTVPECACNIEGSALGLQEGEGVFLEDLLYALMLNSGNDVAIAVACHIGGSVEGFVHMMNKKAEDIGALNTHFSNPNGLPAPDHYATAYDLALISRYAMQNRKFRELVSTKVKNMERTVPDAQIYLQNHNRLLWRYDGAAGIKTGYTNAAGQCLVAAALRQERELITVVLKSVGADIWTDTEQLLDYGFDNFVPVILTQAGRFVANAPVRFGDADTVPVQTGSFLSYNFAAGEIKDDIQRVVTLDENITAPVFPGEKLGELTFFGGGREVGRVDLLAQQGVGRHLLAQRCLWLLPAFFGLFIILSIIRSNRARHKRWERYKMKYRR
jgi:D-alanyl-D-alanine carboxypeptidase (penicillin-binding protein 5/6)